MSRALNDLQPVFRVIVFELLARTIEAGIPIVIVGTGRTQAEQDDAVRRGVSWRAHSLHQDGLAIDIAPFLQWSEFGEDKLQWDGEDPQWLALGRLGEALGLRWGGRWVQRDLGHFEYRDPNEQPPGRAA